MKVIDTKFSVRNRGYLPDGALLSAAAYNQEMMVDLLLGSGADIEAAGTWFGKKLLHIAAQQSNEAIVRLLLARSVNIKAFNSKGITAAEHALNMVVLLWCVIS